MGGCIMKWCFHVLRIRALQVLTRAVKPSLPLGGYLAPSLGFASPSDAARFIHACGGALVEAPAAAAAAAAGGGGSGGSGEAPPLPAPEHRLVLDCKASAIEMVREVTREELAFRGAALGDYLKAAVAASATG